MEHSACNDTDEHVAQNNVGVKHGYVDFGLLDFNRVQVVEFKGNYFIEYAVDTLLQTYLPHNHDGSRPQDEVTFVCK
jgi:hypothetical protein